MGAVPNNGDSGEEVPLLPRRREDAMLDALGDPVIRRILASTDATARTAPELNQSTGVPLTTLYRKIHELEELGLVGIERSAITPDGKRVDFYRSCLEEARVEVKGGSFRLQARYRNLSSLRMERLWGRVREEVRR